MLSVSDGTPDWGTEGCPSYDGCPYNINHRVIKTGTYTDDGLIKILSKAFRHFKEGIAKAGGNYPEWLREQRKRSFLLDELDRLQARGVITAYKDLKTRNIRVYQ